jgi:hypothetical protein
MVMITSRPRMLLVIASIAGLSSAAAHSQEDEIPRCKAAFLELLGEDVFNRHPTVSPTSDIKPRAPDVRTGTAQLYRTAIREQAKRAPDFAGHYTIIRIGCGAGTVCPAILDAISGKVYFPAQLRIASAMLVDTGEADVETLNYRRNSNLLALFGTPNEQMREEGLSYYVWRSSKLTRTRFIPRAKLCGEEHR